jgi:hypothetical protein
MKRTIKVGDSVVFARGFGIVIDRYKEALGHYWLYEVELQRSWEHDAGLTNTTENDVYVVRNAELERL